MTEQLAMRTAGPSSGSRTVTINETVANTDAQSSQQASSSTSGVLQLRGASGNDSRRVAWSEGTVDNEGMGKKKSKICCIYHKPKAFDESSDESSSSDEDSDDSASSRSSRSSTASGINASKALRERRAAAASENKAKGTATDGEHDGCTHNHSHGTRKAKRTSSHRNGVRGGGGSRTMTVLAQPAEANHIEDGAEDDGRPSKPKSNAYERGPA